MECGRNIKTYENIFQPCKRMVEHTGGCNPFSDNPPQGESNGDKSDSKNQSGS